MHCIMQERVLLSDYALGTIAFTLEAWDYEGVWIVCEPDINACIAGIGYTGEAIIVGMALADCIYPAGTLMRQQPDESIRIWTAITIDAKANPFLAMGEAKAKKMLESIRNSIMDTPNGKTILVRDIPFYPCGYHSLPALYGERMARLPDTDTPTIIRAAAEARRIRF
ncbi:MAG: hypothetical protein D6771_03080 [Zetaproteobacteria bacterium]|nr:MAG: hypothetical protein D6771_03080 [Zetaproteobacteria bacterium]